MILFFPNNSVFRIRFRRHPNSPSNLNLIIVNNRCCCLQYTEVYASRIHTLNLCSSVAVSVIVRLVCSPHAIIFMRHFSKTRLHADISTELDDDVQQRSWFSSYGHTTWCRQFTYNTFIYISFLNFSTLLLSWNTQNGKVFFVHTSLIHIADQAINLIAINSLAKRSHEGMCIFWIFIDAQMKKLAL